MKLAGIYFTNPNTRLYAYKAYRYYRLTNNRGKSRMFVRNEVPSLELYAREMNA